MTVDRKIRFDRSREVAAERQIRQGGFRSGHARCVRLRLGLADVVEWATVRYGGVVYDMVRSGWNPLVMFWILKPGE